ncbi:hypothetical protein [Paenibacillus sp. FSL R5-0912]|uniref:hypothetical protein n=1 Tax=Paenibacillus sp. FSL R5-0912 TaxID=1536771 RepID=UPI0004F5E9B5|nr:hypothetical protein [Paenibacillus sp. FSL R5-0912]AIQ44208.1 hypothetical protein R50912_32635 [Paenibacillus sp. FSL R5-0912]
MKYNNNPAEPLEQGKMLPFVQQFWIRAGMRRIMLYLVQDFTISNCISATENGLNREIPRQQCRLEVQFTE